MRVIIHLSSVCLSECLVLRVQGCRNRGDREVIALKILSGIEAKPPPSKDLELLTCLSPGFPDLPTALE